MTCVVCKSNKNSKISNLQKLGFEICMNPSCVDGFIKEYIRILPICLRCTEFDAKKKTCPIVGTNEVWGGIGLDLKFPRFGLFCSKFALQDSFQQAKLSSS
jgi:hypothetical protein